MPALCTLISGGTRSATAKVLALNGSSLEGRNMTLIVEARKSGEVLYSDERIDGSPYLDFGVQNLGRKLDRRMVFILPQGLLLDK